MAASLATATRTTTTATSATANHPWVRSTTGRGGDGGMPVVLTRYPRAAAASAELRSVRRPRPASAGLAQKSRALVVTVTGDNGWFAVTAMG